MAGAIKQRGAEVARWGELSADRHAWRDMLTRMTTPPQYRTLANRRPRRRAAAKVQAAIDRGRRFEALPPGGQHSRAAAQ